MPLNTTPRKYHKLGPFDLGKMHVISINDFDRAAQMQCDGIMESAIDDLVALTEPPGHRPTVADVVVQFGQLRLSDDLPLRFRFDFEPPTTSKQWPGPRYGSFSLHKPLPSVKSKTKAKTKVSKSTRKHGQPEDFKQTLRPLKVSKPKKTKKADVAPVMLSTKTSRDPPLELLGLPPELRNAIWNLLAVRDDPIEAQLRPIRPCKKPTKLRGTIVRRFPIEPVVASVNKQVRREVLSIFYGDNRFVFQKNGFSTNEGHRMTDPAIMSQWRSREVANFLTQLDLRFTTNTRTFRSMHIVYTFRRLPHNKITINVHAERFPSKAVADLLKPCLCIENDIIAAVKDLDRGGDVVQMAMQLTRTRNEVLFGDACLERGANKTFRPEHRFCEKCERDTFEALYSS